MADTTPVSPPDILRLLGRDGLARHRARIDALALAGELDEPGDRQQLLRRIWPIACTACGAKVGAPCVGGATLVPDWHISRWNDVPWEEKLVSQESERVYRELMDVAR